MVDGMNILRLYILATSRTLWTPWMLTDMASGRFCSPMADSRAEKWISVST